MKRRIIKYAGLLLLAALIIIQFFHPEKNLSDDQSNAISKNFQVPDTISNILKTSCYDCHSNHTEYPWYSKIQPVDWWLQDHINEGKEELNFSEFSSYRPWRQFRKFEKIGEEVEEEGMPLPSYLFIHRYAKLNEGQKELLKKWTSSMRDSMKMHYPPDSLVNPNKKRKEKEHEENEGPRENH